MIEHVIKNHIVNCFKKCAYTSEHNRDVARRLFMSSHRGRGWLNTPVSATFYLHGKLLKNPKFMFKNEPKVATPD